LNFELQDWKLEFEDQFRGLYRRDYADKGSRQEYLRGIQDCNTDPLALMLDRTRVNRDNEGQMTQVAEEYNEVDEWLAMSKPFTLILSFILICQGPDNRPPLLVWKSLEHRLPGLAAMAQDLLCIPMAGTGVERVFNFARDICGYRRGQLQPKTIRALLLIYFSQIMESRIDALQQTLYHTVNIDDMTQDEMEAEISAREEEINIRHLAIDKWDEDNYISDEEGRPDPHRRASERTAYIARKRRLRHDQEEIQELSVSHQSRQRALQQRLSQIEQRNRENPAIWDVPSEGEDRAESEASRNEGWESGIEEQTVSISTINRNSANETLELPTPNTRRRAYSIGQEDKNSKRQR